MPVADLIKNKTIADKVKKLTLTNVNEYEAARQVIEEEAQILNSKAEALKKKLDA